MEGNSISMQPEVKQDKHIQIYRASQSVRGINDHLSQVIQKITGQSNPQTDNAEKEQDPPLSHFLNEDGNFLREQVALAHKQIEEIIALLF